MHPMTKLNFGCSTCFGKCCWGWGRVELSKATLQLWLFIVLLLRI